MSRTTALRRQHDAALQLASRILEQVDRYEGCGDAHGISVSLAKLLGLLRIHLAQEDKSLYPSIIESGDERIATIAQRFVAEMGGLAERLGIFASRWSNSAAIASNFDDFRREARIIIDALGSRIARENEELYPLVDALYSQSLKSAA